VEHLLARAGFPFFSKRRRIRADKDAFGKAAHGVAGLLQGPGFTDADWQRCGMASEPISLRDHRIQLLLRDGVKYRDAQAAAKKAARGPYPTSNGRPGCAPQRGRGRAVKALDQRLTNSGSLRDAAGGSRRPARRQPPLTKDQTKWHFPPYLTTTRRSAIARISAHDLSASIRPIPVHAAITGQGLGGQS